MDQNENMNKDEEYFDLESLLAQYKPSDDKDRKSTSLSEEDVLSTLGDEDEYKSFINEMSSKQTKVDDNEETALDKELEEIQSIESKPVKYLLDESSLEEIISHIDEEDEIIDNAVEETISDELDYEFEKELFADNRLTDDLAIDERVNEEQSADLEDDFGDIDETLFVEEKDNESLESNDENLEFDEEDKLFETNNEKDIDEELVKESEETTEFTEDEIDSFMLVDSEEDDSEFFSKEVAEEEMDDFVQQILEDEVETNEEIDDYIQERISDDFVDASQEDIENDELVYQVDDEKGEEFSSTRFYSQSSLEETKVLNGDIDDSVISDEKLFAALGIEEEKEIEEVDEEETSSQVKINISDSKIEKKKVEKETFEYTDQGQTKSIIIAYKQTKQSLLIKLILSAVLAVILLGYEQFPLMGIQLFESLNPSRFPVVYTMIGLQILFLCAIPAYEQIIYGIKNLFTLKPSLESIPVVMIIFDLIYSIIVSCTAVQGVSPKLIGFPIALAVVLLMIFALVNITREMYSFDVVSSNKNKYVVSTAKKEIEEATIYDVEGSEPSHSISVDRAHFVNGYFARTYSESEEINSYVAKSLIVSIAVALLVSVAAIVLEHGFVDISLAFLSVIVMASPLSMLVSFSFPLFKVNKKIYADDTTIIGETTIEKYAEASFVSVEDVVAIPSNCVKLQNIIIYNKNRIENVLYYSSSMFTYVGGPLADVFESATNEIGRSDNVRVLENTNGFLKAEIDGRKVIFARKNELKKNGFDISSAALNDDVAQDVSVMYMFIDYKLAAKLFIKYSINPEFAEVVNDLDNNGMRVTVRTFDPNVEDALFKDKVSEGAVSVKRATIQEANMGINASVDGGMVSLNKPISILKALKWCETILYTRKIGFIVGLISVVLAAVLVLVSLLTKSFGTLPSILLAAYQAFWVAIAFIIPSLLLKK